jgi:hypothetical protein
MESFNLQVEIIEKQLDNLKNPEIVNDIKITDSTIVDTHQIISSLSGEKSKPGKKEELLKDIMVKFINLSGEKKYFVLKSISESVRDLNPNCRIFRSMDAEDISKRKKNLLFKKNDLLQKHLIFNPHILD